MRKVIVNSTPLIILYKIGYLDILQKLYQDVFVPTAVYQEVTAIKDSACIQIMDASKWIHVMPIQDNAEKKMYKAKLHAGEVEVMILAQEQKAGLVIIDDNAAKKTAKYLGLAVTGTLGILLRAKQLGFLDAISPLLSEMKQHGFYIDSKLESLILEQAGELPCEKI